MRMMRRLNSDIGFILIGVRARFGPDLMERKGLVAGCGESEEEREERFAA
jgi:hypothetical protein